MEKIITFVLMAVAMGLGLYSVLAGNGIMIRAVSFGSGLAFGIALFFAIAPPEFSKTIFKKRGVKKI